MYMKDHHIYAKKYFGFSKEHFNQIIQYWNFMYPDRPVKEAE